MENYVIEATLRSGAQAGAVLKVAHKKMKRSYVMKQIFCKKENEKDAERALIEAKSLENLSHEFVCGYKEYFSFWSNEKNAIIVCIVMDYYLLGDLKKILNARRKEKKAIEEDRIKKWLAQMVSVLAYIHSKNIIHRDLKPENIFIKNDNLDLVVGDFGIVAEMGDVRVATRTVIGSPVWMAPEVIERPYDERSDLWSLGCILVALMTCQTVNEEDLCLNMMAMKNDETAIEVTMSLIEKSYSKDLVSVVRSLLKRKFEERPSSSSLLKVPIIESWIDKMNSSEKLPASLSVPSALAFLKQHAGNVVLVAEALQFLSSAADLRLDNAGERVVLDAVRSHQASAEVCALGLRICCRLAEKMRNDDLLLTTEAAEILTAAAETHPEHFAVQAPFLSFCHSAAAIQTEQFANLTDLVPCLLRALDSFWEAEEVGVNACSALAFLCDNDDANFDQVTDLGAVRAAHRFLRSHRSDPACVHPALTLLMLLSERDTNLAAAEELNLVHLLLASLQLLVQHVEVVTTALRVLENLVTEEQMARSFIECQGVEDRATLEGLTVLSAVIEKHKSQEEVVANVMLVLRAAMEHDDVAGICDTSVVKSLTEKASKLHPKNKDIKECGEELKKIFT